MNTPQEYQEERKGGEGLGGRVRRFVDAELGRIRDKDDRGTGTHTDHPGDPDPADREESYSEPVSPHVGGPGHVDRPATTTPHDAGREPTPQSAPPEEFRGQSGDQLTADGGAARAGLLNDVATLRDEWQRVQGTFVDDPQRAVHEASMLIDRTLDEIRANVGSEHPSETMSTEDLRVSFQRYREFFQRLLSA